MGIHRARIVLATVALAGLAGCQSSGSNSLAFWKSNPLSSKTAAVDTKPQYPPKPSTQVANPLEAKNLTASGLAANPSLGKQRSAPSSFPGAVTSYTAPANNVSGTKTSSGGDSPLNPAAAPGMTNTIEPVVSPQRGYYSSPSGINAKTAGVGTSPNGAGTYPSLPSTSDRSVSGTASGFRSGAKDYTSSPMAYAASPGADKATTGGATVPRFGAAADRSPSSPDRDAASYRPLATAARVGTNSSGAGSSYGAGSAPYGSATPSTGGALPAGPSGSSNPFQANHRASPYSVSGSASDRANSAYLSPSSVRGPERNATASAQPFGNSNSLPAAANGNDRANTPVYRDYPSTESSPQHGGTSLYGSGGSNDAPVGARSVTQGADQRPSASSNHPAADYRPGNTGYRPPASDYRPGDTGYRPPAASPYRPSMGSSNLSGASAPSDEPPPFRPGNTSDYVPKSANAGVAPTTASRDPFQPRGDAGVQPTGYTAGAPDYRR